MLDPPWIAGNHGLAERNEIARTIRGTPDPAAGLGQRQRTIEPHGRHLGDANRQCVRAATITPTHGRARTSCLPPPRHGNDPRYGLIVAPVSVPIAPSVVCAALSPSLKSLSLYVVNTSVG